MGKPLLQTADDSNKMEKSSKPPLLELKNVSKSFSGICALDKVNLSVCTGEVVALLGENGAGKSTLMKILSGVWPAGSYEGKLCFGGFNPVQFKNTRDAHEAGIAMIHQELSVFPELTVAEHLELDRLPYWIRWKDLYQRTQAFLDSLNLGLHSQDRVGDLSIGGRQLVEIARALYRNAKLLIFDEPTSALTDQEVSRLYQVIERLRAEGHAIIYITHRLNEVFHLADRLVILRDGHNAGETSLWRDGQRISRTEIEPQLITWMVGRPIQDIYPKKDSKLGDELLRVESLQLSSSQGKTLIHDLSFVLREGEILGLAGLLGAGRSETFQAIFGAVVNGETEGRIWIRRQRKKIENPQEAIQARMAFVSEDRKGTGLVLGQSICSNMSLAALNAGHTGLTSRKGLTSWVSRPREKSQTEYWIKELKIKSTDLDQNVSELSGGNQQKIVLAKWLMSEPEILFLDEPTRGIDVGAKAEIYHWIQKLASQGMGLVVASSEMPELLGLCHRILVLREGRLSAEFSSESTTQEDIMRAASL